MVKTDKKLYKKVSERANGKCEVCHRPASLELHHILRRKVKATYDNCIMLCPKCHRGTYGVHGREGHGIDTVLKLNLQDTYLKQGKTEEEIRQLMGGKIYDK